MKAVGVFPGRRTVELVSFDEPKISAPEEVKIRVLQVGVCGTDREICDFEYGTTPDAYTQHLTMADGKDELAMDQLDAVSGGTKARLVEVEITKPVTKVPTPSGPVPIPYPNTASNKPT